MTPTTTGTPDLHQYDVVLLSSSAGKDSQAMVDAVVRLADSVGYPRARLVVVHADLGRVEWSGTRELAHTQAAHYGLRIEVVSRPQGDLLSHVEARGKWPSSAQRYCTSDHKRAQCAKVVTALHRDALAAGHSGTYRVLECHGLRAQESPARAKKAPFARNERLSTAARAVDTWLPIHGWSVEQVWATIKASGCPHHRAYDLGMPRLSCVFCIFSPKAALLLAGQHNPALLDAYVAVEDKIGHLFRHKFSLRVLRNELRAGACSSEPVTDWAM
jgi:3'-phosphoadenosine 5'-phosphosulfate sulfotransferase (PAPS reductase)/FAD synthetase